MSTRSQVLQSLQAYVKKIEETLYAASSTSERKTYESQLEVTFEEFSECAKVEFIALGQFRAQVGPDLAGRPSADAVARLRQLRTIKATYEELTHLGADLPFPSSPLLALLAVRNVQRLISETKQAMSATHQQLIKTRQRLIEEDAGLKVAKLVADALVSRIARLKVEVDEKSKRSPYEVAQDTLHEQDVRKQFYESETRRLVRALVQFINEELAAMLAAEELGGPIAGNILEVSNDILEAGFSRKGKAKKIVSCDASNSTKRQERIDVVWGLGDSAESETEREAAAKEMRSLVEELLNVAAEEGTGTYTTLTRDSAASRFLVRAKVAQFHSKDARKVRLLDFGRELDD